MAKSSGLGDNFYLGGYDLSGDISSVDTISGGPAVLDVTPITSFANTRIGGLRNGSISFTSFFDYTGTTVAPSFPLTTVPVVNTYGWGILATIVGGTVSNVSVNGITVGTGDGTYAVPSGGTISITYTSTAPTWTWVGIPAEHNALSVIPTTDVIATYIRGSAVGNAAACLNSKQTDYDPTRDATGNLTLKVDLIADSYGLEWGIQLTPGLRTDTSATLGTDRDDGAASNYGMQAYMELVELVGTSVDIDIEHSADNSSWTSILDFGSQTAIGGFRQATSNTTTIDRYLRVITTGTFTYAQFAVVTCRNKNAGQVF